MYNDIIFNFIFLKFEMYPILDLDINVYFGVVG
jgi:hypothetical protein